MLKSLHNKNTKNAKVHLAKVLHETIELSEDGLQKVLDLFTLVELKKDTDIIKKNEVNNNVYFISKGMVRAYYYKSEKEIIDWFAVEGRFFGNIHSDTKKSPGFDRYKTVEKTILLKANYLMFENLFASYPNVEKLVNNVILKNYIDYVERVHSYKGLSSTDKYILFVKKYPTIANRVPLRYLANYLSIAPETLSRIRATPMIYQES